MKMLRFLVYVAFQIACVQLVSGEIFRVNNALHSQAMENQYARDRVLYLHDNLDHPHLVGDQSNRKMLMESNHIHNFEAFTAIPSVAMQERTIVLDNIYTNWKAGTLPSLGSDTALLWKTFDGEAVLEADQERAIEWLKKHYKNNPHSQEDLDFLGWCLTRQVTGNIWWTSAQLNKWRSLDYQKLTKIGDLLQFGASSEAPITANKHEIAAQQLSRILNQLKWPPSTGSPAFPPELEALQTLHDSEGRQLYGIRTQQLLTYMYNNRPDGFFKLSQTLDAHEVEYLLNGRPRVREIIITPKVGSNHGPAPAPSPVGNHPMNHQPQYTRHHGRSFWQKALDLLGDRVRFRNDVDHLN
ncbi:hypothetical protein O181_060170 [Austropuccinia psidii MF-1]|uniref:Uncharacterized protein n=1 Tax=Austropuccinia psidii MF-1 TaxID=1389203 RepID=A0A9Q3ECW1_9BASI|nr:hypothetical protein [Austropuccinia psidii MF-1]